MSIQYNTRVYLNYFCMFWPRCHAWFISRFFFVRVARLHTLRYIPTFRLMFACGTT
uniref:Uncharacterized protein n=1 Tax=Anguilla anguilla TaxID=7936 RepID=A0A0E9PYL4_ANGAN